jgi:putative transferase (TIGR04331 family)
MLDYIRDQRIFYQALGKEARDLLLWRYFGALWEDVERFKEFAPKLRTQHGLKRQLGKESNFISDLRKCRLAVHTANETTYLEALAANFPSIIFWDPRYYTVRESLQPLFDELASAEILHYTPESAAHKLTEIYRDPAEWWGRADVQEARRGFCAALARTSDDWLIQWREELRSLAG